MALLMEAMQRERWGALTNQWRTLLVPCWGPLLLLVALTSQHLLQKWLKVRSGQYRRKVSGLPTLSMRGRLLLVPRRDILLLRVTPRRRWRLLLVPVWELQMTKFTAWTSFATCSHTKGTNCPVPSLLRAVFLQHAVRSALLLLAE